MIRLLPTDDNFTDSIMLLAPAFETNCLNGYYIREYPFRIQYNAGGGVPAEEPVRQAVQSSGHAALVALMNILVALLNF